MQKTLRPLNNPYAWLGDDRLLLDDTSDYGLRRRVIARKGELMNTVFYISQAMDAAGESLVRYWLVERDGFWFLWICWKEQK